MTQKQNNLCISIRSLKRSQYLKRCLDSLLSNESVEDADFYLLQDGAVNPFSKIRYATDEEIEASLKVFQESKLPNKTISRSEDNMGCALQKHHQLSVLFPYYDYVVLVDNDLVFNKYYIKTLKVLFKQFENDTKAGILQTSFKYTGPETFQSEKEAKKLENMVTYGFSHRWELGFWRESWERIKPFMKDYFELTKECDFKELLYNPNVYQDIRKKLHEIYGNEHADFSLERCAIKAGYKGIHTLTLRHKTIGREGIYSFRASRFDAGGYGKIELHQTGSVERYRLCQE